MRTVFLFLVFAVLILAGCTSTSQNLAAPLPQVTFENFETIKLPVGEVEIINNYNPSFVTNNKATSFPTPPDVALRRYFNKRFAANGTTDSGKLLVSIEDASVKHRIIKSQNDFKALFGVDDKEEYDLDVNLMMDHLSPNGTKWATANVTFDKTKTFSRRLSLDELERELVQFVEETILAIDVPIQENVATILKESTQNQRQNSFVDTPVKTVLPKDTGLSENSANTQMQPILE